MTNIFKGIFTNPIVWKGGALAFAGIIGWQIGKLIDKLFGISEKFEKLQNKWDKASKEVGDVVTKATNAAAQAARDKGGKEGFEAKQALKFTAGIGKYAQERSADIGYFGRRHIAGIEAAQRQFILDNINEYMKYSPSEIDLMRQKWLSEGGFVVKTAFKDHMKYGQMREKAFLTYLQRHGTKLTDAEMQRMYTDYKVGFAKRHPGKAMLIEGEEYARRKGAELYSAAKEGTGKALEKVTGAYTQATGLASQEIKKLATNTKELRETMVNMGEKAATATKKAGEELGQNFVHASNVVSNNVSQNIQRVTNVGTAARREVDIFTESVIRGNTMEDAY
jgi:polyhydroxyalkanoate synthesis regulator phasin